VTASRTTRATWSEASSAAGELVVKERRSTTAGSLPVGFRRRDTCLVISGTALNGPAQPHSRDARLGGQV